ncbi:hypothetical protein [Pyrobaculum sp. 3827-6]|uniref:hypothetical protein n=1 Tax=Pyrobaculum sp. 3827-6 TaxID=2983604 RepID=UPI0035A9AD87
MKRAAAHFFKMREVWVRHVGAALGPEVQVLDERRAALKATYDSIMFIFNILEQEPGKILIEEGRGRMLLTRVPRAFSTARRVSPVVAPGAAYRRWPRRILHAPQPKSP